jgi:hypothetical protein
MLYGESHWKATIHTYSLKKFHKTHKHIVFANRNTLPKSARSHFGCLCHLGVKTIIFIATRIERKGMYLSIFSY